MISKNHGPLIFDIRQFSLDDGPGIRTTVFFKGCPLSCAWCHNPESISLSGEIAYYHQKCIRCGDCAETCNMKAVNLKMPGLINRKRCTACGKCAETCPTTALRVLGRHYTVDELLEILLNDREYYETSNGGITFSGGEPTLHTDYLSEVMIKLKKENIHITLQTCGQFQPEEFRKKLLPYIDLIFYDIKIIDSKKHKKYTGSGNERILDNFMLLLEESRKNRKFEIISRTPLIPGINDSKKDIAALHALYESLDHKNFIFLPYNPGGLHKRDILGMKHPAVF